MQGKNQVSGGGRPMNPGVKEKPMFQLIYKWVVRRKLTVHLSKMLTNAKQ